MKMAIVWNINSFIKNRNYDMKFDKDGELFIMVDFM